MLLRRQGWRTLEVRMNAHERTPLEQALRQLIEGDVQMLAQAIWIGELISLRKDTTEAVAVFDALEDKQRLLRETLEREQAKAACRRT
jgi:hypothetical protein